MLNLLKLNYGYKAKSISEMGMNSNSIATVFSSDLSSGFSVAMEGSLLVSSSSFVALMETSSLF